MRRHPPWWNPQTWELRDIAQRIGERASREYAQPRALPAKAWQGRPPLTSRYLLFRTASPFPPFPDDRKPVNSPRSAHAKKTPGVRLLPYVPRRVNKHSQKLLVAATGSLLPSDTLPRHIASRPPLKSTIDLMQLSRSAARNLSIQEKHFLSE